MFQYSSKSLFSPVREATKLFFFLAASIAAFVFHRPLSLFLLFAFLSTVLALAGFRGFKRLYFGLLAFLLLADASFLIFLSDTGLDLVQLTLSSNLRVLCLFSAMTFFTFSTDIFALLKALKVLKIPESVYLPIYVLFRFLPEMEHDLAEIIAIQKMRGVSRKKPMLYLRSILLPLLFTSLQRADDLAIAYYLRKKQGRKC